MDKKINSVATLTPHVEYTKSKKISKHAKNYHKRNYLQNKYQYTDNSACYWN
jgi:hypothetical protein